MEITSKSLEETRRVAGQFITSLSKESDKATVVGFRGDLGSGKTTFIQSVGKILGVSDHMTSPTFVIQKNYPLSGQKFDRLIHIDAYRIENEGELLNLDWEEIISKPENLILVEWPERVQGILPDNTQYVSMEFIDETTRKISF